MALLPAASHAQALPACLAHLPSGRAGADTTQRPGPGSSPLRWPRRVLHTLCRPLPQPAPQPLLGSGGRHQRRVCLPGALPADAGSLQGPSDTHRTQQSPTRGFNSSPGEWEANTKNHLREPGSRCLTAGSGLVGAQDTWLRVPGQWGPLPWPGGCREPGPEGRAGCCFGLSQGPSSWPGAEVTVLPGRSALEPQLCRP